MYMPGMQMQIKKIQNYNIYQQQVLGSGANGVVYKCVQTNTGQCFAVKVIDRSNIKFDSYMEMALQNQIKIMRRISSKNTVKLEDVLMSPKNIYIIQELCDQGDLRKYLNQNKSITEKEAIKMLKQICNGMLTLVREGIIHRDLKPGNIMIAKGELKIGDFGYSKQYAAANSIYITHVGTPLYMSLQILQYNPYTSKSDLWSVGMIFYEILHGRVPWAVKDIKTLRNKIIEDCIEVDSKFGKNTQDFLKRALRVKQKDRMSWNELFQHPIFQGCFDIYATKDKQFQNKYKSLLYKIQDKVTERKINLLNLWKEIGLKEKDQLNCENFKVFLLKIQESLTEQECIYYFEKFDIDKNGTVSLNEIEQELAKNEVNVIPEQHKTNLKHTISFNEPEEIVTLINSELMEKAEACFEEINKLWVFKNLNLTLVFNAVGKKNDGELNFETFYKIISKSSKILSREQCEILFKYLDTNNSQTIDFNQMNTFFNRVISFAEERKKIKAKQGKQVA